MATLFLIATPIGNLEDITQRALRVLGEVTALACEDTRQTRKIFARYEVEPPKTIFSYHEHNAAQAGKRVLGLLGDGRDVALCSDGGYPGISDPGYRLIEGALEAGHELDVVPGPSAVPVALLLSGLSTASYTFKGFPPRKSGPRKRFLEADRDAAHTLVIFESPYRVSKLLVDALEILGDRRAAVCVELTKKYQRVHRGYLADLVESHGGTSFKGEVTVVVAGNHPKFLRS